MSTRPSDAALDAAGNRVQRNIIMTSRRPDPPERWSAVVPGMLLLAHFAIALLFVLDFILFQAAATATTVAIYSIIPMLDDSIVRGGPSWTWIRIFQIVSPTITLPGGIVTVLSSYYFARRAQEETRRADAEAQKAQQEALLRQAAEAEVQALKDQLAQAQAPPRSRRRRLRNGNSAAPR